MRSAQCDFGSFQADGLAVVKYLVVEGSGFDSIVVVLHRSRHLIDGQLHQLRKGPAMSFASRAGNTDGMNFPMALESMMQ